MGKIAYAHVVYRDTKQFVTVPITDVKSKKNSGSSIEPIHDSDFNKKKVYYVKWSSCGDRCEEDHEHCGYYPAFLLLLGESEEQIQTKVNEGRRLIIPNLKDCSGSEEPQLEPPRKTKRTTFTKDTVTNKNKEILQKYNARLFLSSRKSLVQNDVEDENETEHTATMDVGGMKNENIKFKGESTNSQKEIDELQKIILYLEEKNRNRQSATITTETDRAKVDSIKRELFRENDHLSSDDENFMPHAQCDEAEGNPGRPRVLSNSRSEDMPKFVRLETVNYDLNHHTGYETKDDQCRNERSEMMEVDLQESGTLNSNRFKAMPKIISVQKFNQRTEYKGDMDQGLNETNMEDNPQGPGMSKGSCTEGTPKMKSFQQVTLNQKQRTEYEAEYDEHENGDGETMEGNDNHQEPRTVSNSRSKDMRQLQSLDSIQQTRYEAEGDQRRSNSKEKILQESCTSNISRSKGMSNCKRLQTVSIDVKKRARYEDNDRHSHRGKEREAVEGNTDDESDSNGSNDPRVNRRVESKMKRRKSDRMDPTLKRKVLNDIEEALQYYEEQQDIDEYGREMYKVQGKKIYLGEGVEVSAMAWFIIKHGKPTLFFKDMVELIWTQRKLVNRCQNLKKVTTTLVNRSPIKELTPEKKRLTYKLFSDYLSEKKFTIEDRMKLLRKVPVLYTEKINYLRRKHYE